MAAKNNHVKTLEQGNLYFFYRPRVQEEDPEGPGDVQRLYLVQSVHGPLPAHDSGAQDVA